MATSAWAAPFHSIPGSSPQKRLRRCGGAGSIPCPYAGARAQHTVTVTGPASASVPLAPLASADSATVVAGVKGKMSPGTYTVVWRTMAKDGHIARGTFAFTVAPAKR
jgi:hypothetical protein